MASLKNRIKDNKGLTLVEILATIVILSIVSLFLLNIAFSSTKQGNLQTKESFQINDAAYVLKQITKDLRKTNEVSPNGDGYNFNKSDATLLVNYQYKNNTLYRAGQIIANNIYDFTIDTSNSDKVEISFTINGVISKTIISLRKGDF